MNVLEKILEEIEERKQEHLCNSELEIEETVNRMEELNWVCALIYYMEEVKKANVQTNDDWIPCSKRLPEVPEGIEDDYCPEFNVTIKGADKATTLKYAPDGTWFDDSGEGFYLTPGLNQIGFTYSDWVPAEYAPAFKVRYREVFL